MKQQRKNGTDRQKKCIDPEQRTRDDTPRGEVCAGGRSMSRARASASAGESPDLRVIVEQLAMEVRNLRRDRLPATPETIEALLAAIHAFFGNETFTAKSCLEECQGEDATANRLAESIERITRQSVSRVPDVDPQKRSKDSLARILSRCCGFFGPWQLMRHREHSSAGSVFRIAKYP